ncbi:hypothetical protein EOD39_7103 [Acipenser ruthenus]|uniref:Uncharacterized protein n=1 Tax=Acipenser ruthenus TaxID=7906 RepID=A0A444U860_ACIRT|nr:hypothetical protein EOD39_7103 [Acipenser ruthenus]
MPALVANKQRRDVYGYRLTTIHDDATVAVPMQGKIPEMAHIQGYIRGQNTGSSGRCKCANTGYPFISSDQYYITFSYEMQLSHTKKLRVLKEP